MRRPWSAAFAGFFGMLLSLCGAVGASAAKTPDRSGHTVPQVDLERYMGKWYEIASFPNWFQRGCCCTTAEYRMSGDAVEVTNTCRKGSPAGSLDVASGRAYTVEGSGNAQLKVQFLWPFKGDYWIIALGDHYEVAVVGHPRRKYLWILSRSPQLEEDVFQGLVALAHAKGYDVDRLRKTDQSCHEAP
jgi:apolipoprotein D and lipocalin family protein